nr:murine toxin [Myxococcus sp. MH1]
MSKIDDVLSVVPDKYFTHVSHDCYVRLLDTPRIWGLPFGPEIMQEARRRTNDFERALVEVLQKTRFRCDVASLNSPDPAWAKIILGALDTAMSANKGKPIQIRFLFGQTPMLLKDGTSPNLIDFQGALIRLVRSRKKDWGAVPEIWMAKFYRLQEGLLSGFSAFVSASLPSWLAPDSDDDFTKMTWNHSKIVASDGAEALVGGHNLNMDLFTSYPPVHDVSVVMHGAGALGAQRFLNRMWSCRTDVVTKERLDPDTLTWVNGDDDKAEVRKPLDPLDLKEAQDLRAQRYELFSRIHIGGLPVDSPRARRRIGNEPLPTVWEEDTEEDLLPDVIREDDLQTLRDLEQPVFEEDRTIGYAGMGEYKRATRVLSIGKHWSGSDMKEDYEKASELMKENLIMGCTDVLRLSQMDLVSAWKKKWSSHVVCHWIMESLLVNPHLVVQVVVSPLDAGAGAEGDQYSFGSGACRTFELFQYYMARTLEDALRPDAERRLRALDRLHIAPFYYTDVPRDKTREGESYFWPQLTPEGYTATLKQKALSEVPPVKGIIGNAVESVQKASGAVFPKVPSAPGNHSKIMIADDQAYVVGSDNLYPGFLSEFNYLVEGPVAVGDMLRNYWEPLWSFSGKHCVNPRCDGGCKTLKNPPKPRSGRGVMSELPASRLLMGMGHGSPLPRPELFGGRMPGGLQSSSFFARKGSGQDWSEPLLNAGNQGKVLRVDLRAPPDLMEILKKDEETAKKEKEERDRLKRLQPVSSSPSTGTTQQTASTTTGGSSPSTKDSSSSAFENHDKIEGAHYYTDQQIDTLLRHYLRGVPNVVVLRGINLYVLNRIAPDTYDEALQGMVADGPPRVLVQPYNINGNHWGLIYIKVAPPARGVRGQARVLFVDPLGPQGVPNLGTLRRAFPDLLVERSGIRYQDDVMGSYKDGQHSCGPWIIQIARHLVANDGALPPTARHPRDAAVGFRAEHQQVLDNLNRQFMDEFVIVEDYFDSPKPLVKSGELPKPQPPVDNSKKGKDSDDDDDFVFV